MNSIQVWNFLRQFYPVAAFLGGFVWDALTIGQRIRVVDFWRLGAFLFGAALLTLWLARREERGVAAPEAEKSLRGRFRSLIWQAPYLLLQFFFGGIFSALFILYFKSSGHLGTWLTAAFLGALLIGNEFAGDHYGQRFTLTWALFALNAILLFNFALPHALGSLNPLWFYASTAAGLLLTLLLRWLAPGRPGRSGPAWSLAALLTLAFSLDMIAPVPLVKRQMAVGQEFVQADGSYTLQIERAAWWQWWRDQASTAACAGRWPSVRRIGGVRSTRRDGGPRTPLGSPCSRWLAAGLPPAFPEHRRPRSRLSWLLMGTQSSTRRLAFHRRHPGRPDDRHSARDGRARCAASRRSAYPGFQLNLRQAPGE
jgi:hypothetical protein